MPLVSIIVPVYNAERHLHRCVDSILSQTLEDFEIILVNDGSTDSSAAICDEYAKWDSRVKVLHKSNGGVASARQAGIDIAIGKYSIHADSDDWVEPTILEEMYGRAIAESADMVICDFVVVWSDKREVARQQLKQQPNHDECLKSLLQGKIMGSLWNKLIRTSLYKKFDIRFAEGINYCEDYIICVNLLSQNIKVEYINRPLYNYDQIVNDHSITRHKTISTYRQRVAFIEVLRDCLNGRFTTEYSYIVTNFAYECLRCGIFSNKEFESLFGKYIEDFRKARYKNKRKLALYLAASGYQWLARCIIKTRKINS